MISLACVAGFHARVLCLGGGASNESGEAARRMVSSSFPRGFTVHENVPSQASAPRCRDKTLASEIPPATQVMIFSKYYGYVAILQNLSYATE